MEIIRFVNDNILWGAPMLILMVGTGVYLSFKTKGIIFRKFGLILRLTLKGIFEKRPDSESGVSPFAAVSTALAGTVGTGNIVGVAIAVGTGGPGAIFWMWICAMLGMVTKFSEVTLALTYRRKGRDGKYFGGPMCYITDGLNCRPLAVIFCLFAIACSLGVGNSVQANSLAESASSAFGVSPVISGAAASLLAGLVLIGGINRISKVAEILVPFMALLYIGGAAVVLFTNRSQILPAFSMIFADAFKGTSAIGGFCGASTTYALRTGVAKGVFTNEAGLGSAPIAHASADTDHPARQGLWGVFEVFFDTVIMCTVTGLVVITSGLWQSSDFSESVQRAFGNTFFGGEYLVAAGLAAFAFATIIAWYYYGERCVEFVFGKKAITIYRLVFVGTVFVGANANIGAVWEIADFLNGMMAIPNLIAIFALTPVVKRLSEDFFASPYKLRREKDFSKLIK